jgi:threonylcarbamoyladenosine tRNA methylthiotransferase MtaB
VKHLVQKLLSIRPDCAIGFDVICGFPGETEEEFRNTYDFINNLPIAYLHVFGYSKRKGTPAALMPAQVNGTVSKARVNALVKLSDEKKLTYAAFIVNHQITLNGVIEKVDKAISTALSDHYLRLYSEACDLTINTYIQGIATAKYLDGIKINNPTM